MSQEMFAIRDCQPSTSNHQEIAQENPVHSRSGKIIQSVVAKEFHPCLICGEYARYVSYGTRACDSCRTFFRRHVVLNSSKPLRCRFKGNCDIRLKNRKFCPACRLAKCRSAGMKSKLVAFESADFEVSSALSVLGDDLSKPNFDQSSAHFGPGYEVHVTGELLRSSVPQPMPPCDFSVKSGDKVVTIRRLGSVCISKIQEIAIAGSEFKKIIPVQLEVDLPVNSMEAFIATLSAGTQKIFAGMRFHASLERLEPDDLKGIAKERIPGTILIMSLFALDSTMSYWTTTCFQPNDFGTPNRLSVECLRFANDRNQLYDSYKILVRTFREVPLWQNDPFVLALFTAVAFFMPHEKQSIEESITRDRQVYTTLLVRYLEEIFGHRRSAEYRMAMATLYSCLAQVVQLRNYFSQVEMGFELHRA